MTPSSSSGGMFFGPDGQPLSEEERAFLEENCGGLDACDAIADDNDVPGDEYDEFLSKGIAVSIVSGYVKKNAPLHVLTFVECGRHFGSRLWEHCLQSHIDRSGCGQ